MNNLNVESSNPYPEHVESSASGAVSDQTASRPEPTEVVGQDQPQIPIELIELIGQEIDRRFQSAKDRRWAQLEKQYGDLHELRQQAVPALQQPAADPENSEFAGKLMERAEALLKRLGLRNTPEAAALLRDQDNLNGPGGTLELVDRVLEYALRDIQAQTEKTPSAAGVIAPGGGASAESDLKESYRRRRIQIRPGDVNALTALKREFREKGLNIF
jgi:hypothetical protein